MQTATSAPDSIVYKVDGNRLKNTTDSSSFRLDANIVGLGVHQLTAEIFVKQNKQVITSNFTIYSNEAPAQLNYKVVQTYPHDIKAYTEGLEFHNGKLYESTGEYGISDIRLVNLKNGKVKKCSALDKDKFGEGITIFNNKIYQLTYREGVGYVRNLSTFAIEKTFNYPKTSEGWGMTHTDKYLLKTDGSECITFMDPITLKDVKNIQVYSNSTSIKDINELEYVNGIIYANVYQTNYIISIDAESGKVLGFLDLSSLLTEADKHPKIDVLNGIAYDPTSKHFFVTGKNWPKMFEIEVNSPNSNKVIAQN
ncbi:glutaminyl-peptide cyclotransferase [Solitalea koreensis]|uniref:glutaminyl-peptide cyclotransferase n=1 Tax=Solitalea koreensis TaxID=543615 RepID=UPI00163DBE5C|nr:glutaminyl-peptide cyclotransferase [Solitalea koreensis]